MFECRSWDVTPNVYKYLCGLLQTEKTMGNMERMAEDVPDIDYQSMQQFISDSPWDYREVMNKVAIETGHLFGGSGEIGLILDESYFQKSGNSSVGVARQWNGRLGKKENSQVAVFAALASGDRSCLIDAEFYLPKKWTEDPERMRTVRVPEERFEHKTKLDLAKVIVRRQLGLGIRFDYVGADGLYGQSGVFCRWLDDAGMQFMLHVHCDQHIYLEDPKPFVPAGEPGRGRNPSKLKTDMKPVRVDTFVSGLKDNDWEDLVTRETTRGPLAIHAYSRTVWVWDGEEKKARKWTLFVRRDFGSDDIKFVLSNDGGELSTIALAQREMQRYRIERSFEDAKQEVSMGDYQTRGWIAWHHHMALVMMAMLFITKTRMIHSDDTPLMSFSDIRAMLAFFLPKKRMTKKEVLSQMTARHKERERVIKSKAKEKIRRLKSAGFALGDSCATACEATGRPEG